VVDLQDVGFKVRVEHYIKTQDFESHVVVHVLGLAAEVGMCDRWLTADQSLDDCVIYLRFKGGDIMPLGG
jgi:hypothetical protein